MIVERDKFFRELNEISHTSIMRFGSAYGINCNFKQRFWPATRELLGWQTTFNNLSVYSPFLPRRGYLEFQKKNPVGDIQSSSIETFERTDHCHSVFISLTHSQPLPKLSISFCRT